MMAGGNEFVVVKGAIDPSAAPWLRAPGLIAIATAFHAAGYEVRVVGGAVRNHLLDVEVADVDLATPAGPDEVIELASQAGLRVLPTGYAHGTVTILTHGQAFEVTTLRRDVETDGRHAIVAFTDDWRTDALRRDFTINALSCDLIGTVFDYADGMADIAARRVRFIGDAAARIREDYLRILRFFRFTAQYADGIPDLEGLAAAAAERNGLDRLSAERVRAEMLKILVAPYAAKVLALMANAGILERVLGGWSGDVTAFARLAAIEKHLDLQPDPILRLAVLARGDARANNVPRKLRLSTAETETFNATLVTPAQIHPDADDLSNKAQLFAIGIAAYQRAVLINWVASASPSENPDWRHLYELPMRWAAPDVPFRGTDLIARGVPPGPNIRAILAAFTHWWVTSGFTTDAHLQNNHLDGLIRERNALKDAQK